MLHFYFIPKRLLKVDLRANVFVVYQRQEQTKAQDIRQTGEYGAAATSHEPAPPGERRTNHAAPAAAEPRRNTPHAEHGRQVASPSPGLLSNGA